LAESMVWGWGSILVYDFISTPVGIEVGRLMKSPQTVSFEQRIETV
jgi:hypothetical protein